MNIGRFWLGKEAAVETVIGILLGGKIG